MIDEFQDRLFKIMEESGVFIDGNINWHTDKFQRFAAKNHHNRKKHIFVCVLNGGVTFGDWRDPTSWKTVWEKQWRELDIPERRHREESLARLAREKEIIRNHAIRRAKELLSHRTWRGETCHDASIDHPYVRAKRIIPYYAKQIRSVLVIRIDDIERRLQSLQFIKSNGFKRFKKNTSPKNNMAWLCEPLSSRYEGTIYLCEGYATGCTIKEATSQPVVCSLSASNLVNVALELRRKFILAQLRICADNDIWTRTNTGIVEAKHAADFTGATLHYPVFDNLVYTVKPTDFNDLFCIQGIEAVEKQIEVVRQIIR